MLIIPLFKGCVGGRERDWAREKKGDIHHFLSNDTERVLTYNLRKLAEKKEEWIIRIINVNKGVFKNENVFIFEAIFITTQLEDKLYTILKRLCTQKRESLFIGEEY